MSVRAIFYSVLLAIAITLGTTFLYTYVITEWWGDWPDAASFGESFGALSCLISALGFIGVLAALYMQYMQISEGQLQTRKTIQLQLLVAYLLSDAVAPADKARIGRVLGNAVQDITPTLLAAIDKELQNG